VNGPTAYEGTSQTEALYQAAELRAFEDQLKMSDVEWTDTGQKHPIKLHLLSAAIRELDRRSLRRRYLPPDLFADTAWMILLDLFISTHQARTIYLEGNAERWGVSEATAARQIAALIGGNLVARVFDISGTAPITLRLTELGELTLEKVLAFHV
jgi:hypothetical protein